MRAISHTMPQSCTMHVYMLRAGSYVSDASFALTKHAMQSQIRSELRSGKVTKLTKSGHFVSNHFIEYVENVLIRILIPNKISIHCLPL